VSQANEQPGSPNVAAAKPAGRAVNIPPKKKSLFEWVMLAIGLSYGDEGEDKWAKQRAAAAAQEQDHSSDTEPRA
jgi:hypothetical protein